MKKQDVAGELLQSLQEALAIAKGELGGIAFRPDQVAPERRRLAVSGTRAPQNRCPGVE